MILLETVKEDRFRKSVFFFGCRVDPGAECSDRVTFDTKQAQPGKRVPLEPTNGDLHR